VTKPAIPPPDGPGGPARTGGRLGWLVGGVGGLAVAAAVARGLRRSGATKPAPADLVTLTRAMLGCAAAGVVVDSRCGEPPARRLFPLAVIALTLDAVDGWVARRTRTTPFGARFDGETDALLILTLSVPAARAYGPWVLVAGVARYAFGAAGWAWPWLRRPLPPRYWRKVATATEGAALAAALTSVLPRWATGAGLVAGSALIAESFGRDVWWLWRRRTESPAE